jgi:hypothetical protein
MQGCPCLVDDMPLLLQTREVSHTAHARLLSSNKKSEKDNVCAASPAIRMLFAVSGFLCFEVFAPMSAACAAYVAFSWTSAVLTKLFCGWLKTSASIKLQAVPFGMEATEDINFELALPSQKADHCLASTFVLSKDLQDSNSKQCRAPRSPSA